jgi:hypothetical protein
VGGAAPLSAQTFLSRHRVGFDRFDRFGLEPPAPRTGRVRGPLFACYRAAESAEGPDLRGGIRRNAPAAPRVETRLFPDADHGHSGRAAAVAAERAPWLGTLS